MIALMPTVLCMVSLRWLGTKLAKRNEPEENSAGIFQVKKNKAMKYTRCYQMQRKSRVRGLSNQIIRVISFRVE